jgi:exodeoxyribonuclease V alpha subunit
MKIELRKDSMRCEPLFDLAGPFVKAGVLSTDAVQLVDLLRTRWAETSPRAAMCLAFVLEAQLRGHAGLDLLEAPTMLVSRDEEPEVEAAATEPEADTDEETPPEPDATLVGPWRGAALAAWQAETLACPMFHGSDAPFTASTIAGGGTLLQSRRMAWEEAELAAALVALATPVDPSHPGGLVVDEAAVRAKLPKLLGKDHAGTPAERALLAVAARRLTIITGGPGTGKTWSIKRALAVLLEAAADQNRPLRVVLAAPTGKAGVRMREAMGEDLEKLDTPEPIRTVLSNLESSTVHRLLKIQPGSGASRFGPKEPLPADVVVVDEASMVDLTLMRRVVKAIGPSTRLILLGDRDQLPSVDVGSVLSDIVRQPLAHREGHSQHAGPLGDCVVRFDVNHRSGAAPALAELVKILQDDRSDTGNRRAIGLLSGSHVERDTLPGRLRTLGPPEDDKPTKAQLEQLLAPWLTDTLADGAAVGYLTHIARILRDEGRAGLVKARPELLGLFDRYRLLAVHRRGPLGVAGLTKALTPLFQKPILDALVGRPVRDEKGGRRPPTDAEQTARRKTGLPTARGLWLGQPVLVTQNAYDVNLWNGDIGLVLPAADDTNRLEVVFPPAEFAAPAEVAAGSKLRTVPVSRLPEHTSGLVLTVHKSQGSQYGHVGLVLAAKDSPIQTRELVYTGITRASERVTWLGHPERLDAALNTVVRRGSALAERISPDAPPAPRSRVGRTGSSYATAPERSVAAVSPAREPLLE